MALHTDKGRGERHDHGVDRGAHAVTAADCVLVLKMMNARGVLVR